MWSSTKRRILARLAARMRASTTWRWRDWCSRKSEMTPRGPDMDAPGVGVDNGAVVGGIRAVPGDGGVAEEVGAAAAVEAPEGRTCSR